MTVLRLQQVDATELAAFLQCWSIKLVICDARQPIPGSFWGDDEAGLISDNLYAWSSTPVHSIFHEASHFICLDEERRRSLHTNAGSDIAEENAVCYLQVLLADAYSPMGAEKMFADMDSWGYSFRLGSSRRWFFEDAQDARDWLLEQGLISEENTVYHRLRGSRQRDFSESNQPGVETRVSNA